VEVVRKLRQHVKEDLGSQIIIGCLDNDASHFHVAMERNPEKEREIAAGGSGSPYVTDYLMGYCRSGMPVDEAKEWA
jgi:20S proteasome alpha/beta subunit